MHNDINPYEAPQQVVLSPIDNADPIEPWHLEGNMLVVSSRAVLPSNCVNCAAETGDDESEWQTLYFSPRHHGMSVLFDLGMHLAALAAGVAAIYSLYTLFITIPLVLLLHSQENRLNKSSTVRISYCKQCRKERKKRIVLSLVAAAAWTGFIWWMGWFDFKNPFASYSFLLLIPAFGLVGVQIRIVSGREISRKNQPETYQIYGLGKKYIELLKKFSQEQKSGHYEPSC